ncbi:MAG: alpha/beta fold hydrolase [Myxococcales bacterium]|nr:alpha/beta fold hydrolase [Myxococcales bacterium]
MSASAPIDTPFDAPIRRAEFYVGSATERLFVRSWEGARASRVLLLHHDLADHSGRYDRFAVWLAGRGTIVYAFDARGHGLSSGTRGHASTPRVLCDDLSEVLREVTLRSPALPVYLIGQGLGALVALELLRDTHCGVHGGLLAALPPAADWPVEGLRAAHGWRLLWPLKRVPLARDPRELSTDEEVVRKYLEDPLVELSVTASLASACARLRRRNGAVDKPILILAGGPEEAMASEASKGLGSEVSLRRYPAMGREVLQEPARERVFADVLCWLRERGDGA